MRGAIGKSVALGLLGVGLALASCGTRALDAPPVGGNGDGQPLEVVKGFGLSPQGFPLDYGKLPDFYAEVAIIPQGGVLWSGLWREDVAEGSDAGEVPSSLASVLQASAAEGITPMAVVGWRSDDRVRLGVPSNPNNDWSNAEAKQLFLDMIRDLARQYRPPFVFLGNENDLYYEQAPEDYPNWVRFYDRAYDAIKSISPETRVGPVFSHEHLAGTGAFAGWTRPHWGALEAHDLDRVDVLGLTLYPWLSVPTPEAVPDDYLDALTSRIGAVPLAILETGWPAEDLGGLDPDWETSASAQVRYVERLPSVLDGISVVVLDWLFLHEMRNPGDSPIDWQLYGSVSLRNDRGEKRAVYDSWIEFLP